MIRFERYDRGHTLVSVNGEWSIKNTGSQAWSLYQYSVLLGDNFRTADEAERFANELGA